MQLGLVDRLPSRAAAVLLARLVTAPQRAHAREELIDTPPLHERRACGEAVELLARTRRSIRANA